MDSKAEVFFACSQVYHYQEGSSTGHLFPTLSKSSGKNPASWCILNIKTNSDPRWQFCELWAKYLKACTSCSSHYFSSLQSFAAAGFRFHGSPICSSQADYLDYCSVNSRHHKTGKARARPAVWSILDFAWFAETNRLMKASGHRSFVGISSKAGLSAKADFLGCLWSLIRSKRHFLFSNTAHLSLRSLFQR